MRGFPAVLLAVIALVAGCAKRAPLVEAPPAAVAAPPDVAMPPALCRISFGELRGWPGPDPAATRAAFAASCAALVRRVDASGHTLAADWGPACAAATAPGDARAFFERWFAAVEVGGGGGMATGYFEPELAGSRTATPGYPHPVYRLPPDLVEADLGLFAASLKGRRVRGRVEGARLVPYHDRAAIEAGALAGRGLELGWAADPYALFFLHIQGSGRLRLADGSIMRIGYAGQNGRDYTAIGRVLRDRGVLGPGQATMQGITAWMRANPAAGAALMRENKSYVFFRELTGAGPVGAMGIALTPEASVAVDPAFVPLGAPLWLETDTTEGPFARTLVAQDTGGAIKGANRVDIFWGAGARAAAIAGALSAPARVVLLLPRPAAERLDARP